MRLTEELDGKVVHEEYRRDDQNTEDCDHACVESCARNMAPVIPDQAYQVDANERQQYDYTGDIDKQYPVVKPPEFLRVLRCLGQHQ